MMKYAFLLSLIFATFTFGQSTTAGTTASLATSISQKKEKFTSPEGRFSISLPVEGAKFEKREPDDKAPKATGGKYIWVSEEGVVTVDYTDDPDFVVKTKKDYADLAEGLKAGVTSFGGKVLAESAYTVGTYRGYGVKFEDADKLHGITRMLIVGGRVYTVFGLGRSGVKGADEFIAAALDTFELSSGKQ